MKFRNKKITMFSIFIGLGFAVFGGAIDFVYAVDNSSYFPLAPLPGTTKGDCSADNKDNKCVTDLNTYIPGIFNLAIGIAGVLAVLMIVIGGVEYMTTDAIGGKSEGKERISNALRGLLLVLVSWILLHTINPKLTIFDLNVADQKIVAEEINNDVYKGTGQKIDNSNLNYQRYVVGRDGVKYTAGVTKTTFIHEGGGESYEETEVYIDKKLDEYRTIKSTDVKGVITTKWLVSYFKGGGYANLDKDGNVIK